MYCVLLAGRRTEINKKRGRPSERSEEARAKGAKQDKNNSGVGGGGAVSTPQTGSRAIFEVYNCQKRISLQEMQDIPDRYIFDFRGV